MRLRERRSRLLSQSSSRRRSRDSEADSSPSFPGMEGLPGSWRDPWHPPGLPGDTQVRGVLSGG